jgi:transcriptional regulator with XRE-family HTH domain
MEGFSLMVKYRAVQTKGDSMTETQQIFIKNLRRIRNTTGQSQSSVAEKCGLSTNYIAGLESGRRFPSPATIDKLCVALEIRPYELFYDPMKDFQPIDAGNAQYVVKQYIKRRLEELIKELD